jgi:hypothetical protein
MESLKNYIIALNLFRPPEGAEPESDHQQRNNIIATRVHLILLFIILIALILATSLSPETSSITISNPTQAQYESLSNPTCPCSRSFYSTINLSPIILLFIKSVQVNLSRKNGFHQSILVLIPHIFLQLIFAQQLSVNGKHLPVFVNLYKHMFFKVCRSLAQHHLSALKLFPDLF